MPKYLRSHINPLRGELMRPMSGRPWTARDRREFPQWPPSPRRADATARLGDGSTADPGAVRGGQPAVVR